MVPKFAKHKLLAKINEVTIYMHKCLARLVDLYCFSGLTDYDIFLCHIPLKQ